MKKNRIFNIAVFLSVSLIFASCQKYLDAKPDKSLVVPSTVQDLQALLNTYASGGGFDPAIGEVASDNYFLLDANYATQSVLLRPIYIWDANVNSEIDWQVSYTRIFKTNVVLDNVDKVTANSSDERNFVKGQAYFLRGWSLFKLMQIYAPTYVPTSANTDLGLPIKLTSDINSTTIRPSQSANIVQIVSDFTNAVNLLPNTNDLLIRPTKAAAYAALAEVQLVAQKYNEALSAAQASLKIKSDLIDYNNVLETSAKPLTFPNEVLFDARLRSVAILNKSIAKVSPNLYDLYVASDKRKTVFYGTNSDNSHFFKGSYDGNLNASTLFSGLAVDEVYLIAAEASARLGKTTDALDYLNTLCKNRYDNSFVPFVASTSAEATNIVLTERRKELAFRGGIRWMDLKRLNIDPQFGTTLSRIIAGTTYTLSSNDPRYAFLIPESVIILTGIPQNPR